MLTIFVPRLTIGQVRTDLKFRVNRFMRSALGLAASMGLNGLIETENVDIFIERITDCGVFRISSMTSLVTYFCPLAIVVI